MAGFSHNVTFDYANAFNNLYQQNRQNHLQRDLTNATNEQNYKIWQEELQYMREQYEKERLENRALIQSDRDYNSPSAVRNRLLQAGINPTLAMQSGSSVGSLQSGVGSPSHQSVPSPSAMVKPDVVPPAYNAFMSNGVNEFLNPALDRLTNIEFKRQEMNLEYFKAILNADNISPETKNRMLSEHAFFKDKWTDLSYDQAYANLQLTNAQQGLTKANTEYQSIINSFSPDEKSKLLRNLDAEYSNILSQVENNNTDVAYKLAQKAISESQKEGVDIDNEQKRRITSSLVDKAYYESRQAYWQNQSMAKAYKEGRVGSYLPAKDASGITHSSDSEHHVNRQDHRGGVR